jgi:hypothetical protein
VISPPLRLPTPSLMQRVSACATCRSPWIAAAVRPLVLPSGAGQSQGSALLTPAEVLLPAPQGTQVGEAIMTKEAEAFCTTNSAQRVWSSMVFRLIRRRWWSLRPRKKGGPLAARRVDEDDDHIILHRTPAFLFSVEVFFVFAAKICPTRVAKGISSAAYRSLARGLALSFRISTIVVA